MSTRVVTMHDTTDPRYPRYEPCRILNQADIACFVWFEDVVISLTESGVIGDLYLIVHDINEADKALRKAGWVTGTPSFKDSFDFLVQQKGAYAYHRVCPPGTKADDDYDVPRVWPPPPEDLAIKGITAPRTVLLPASQWNVSAEALRSYSSPNAGFHPPADIMVDALITSHLDAPPNSILQRHIAQNLQTLYDNADIVRVDEFEDHISVENRQYHRDALTAPALKSPVFVLEQQRNREEVRNQQARVESGVDNKSDLRHLL